MNVYLPVAMEEHHQLSDLLWRTKFAVPPAVEIRHKSAELGQVQLLLISKTIILAAHILVHVRLGVCQLGVIVGNLQALLLSRDPLEQIEYKFQEIRFGRPNPYCHISGD